MRTASLVVLLLVAGCGPSATPTAGDEHVLLPSPTATATADEDAAAVQVEPQERLAAVAQVARTEGSVRYTGVVEGGLDGEPREVEARLSGALDTVAGAGRADVELVALAELAALAPEADVEDAAELDALSRLSMWWTPEQVTVEAGGQRESVPRDPDDDHDGGMLERVPGEPAALLTVVAAADGVTVEGQEQVDGVATTRLRGEVDPAAAVDAGLGTQAQLTVAQLPSLPVDVWLDERGRPLRISYRVDLPSLQQGRTRSLVTTYDYRDWGRPVDVTP